MNIACKSLISKMLIINNSQYNIKVQTLDLNINLDPLISSIIYITTGVGKRNLGLHVPY